MARTWQSGYDEEPSHVRIVNSCDSFGSLNLIRSPIRRLGHERATLDLDLDLDLLHGPNPTDYPRTSANVGA